MLSMKSKSEKSNTHFSVDENLKNQQKAVKRFTNSLLIKEDKNFNINKHQTNIENKLFDKETGEQLLKFGLSQLTAWQDKFYAEGKRSFLIILQAMDAAGKDGAIRHVMGGLNPQGVKVNSFKVPSKEELSHDFLWRHYKALPTKGEIGIFNRSHYENVLVTRVHPEFILNERIPGIDDVKKVNKKFWENRFKQINHFEKTLHENGTVILKFFLNVSKDEQQRRLIERIENPNKNWKFSAGDAAERELWDKYMKAYEEMIKATSKDYAPWYILPADDKWFTRLCMSSIIQQQFEKINPQYPKISGQQELEILKVKEQLLKND